VKTDIFIDHISGQVMQLVVSICPPVYYLRLLSRRSSCLQQFDTVGWVSERASSLQKLTDEALGLLLWLSVWSEVQIVCI